jgi:hypothetical protein
MADGTSIDDIVQAMQAQNSQAAAAPAYQQAAPSTIPGPGGFSPADRFNKFSLPAGGGPLSVDDANKVIASYESTGGHAFAPGPNGYPAAPAAPMVITPTIQGGPPQADAMGAMMAAPAPVRSNFAMMPTRPATLSDANPEALQAGKQYAQASPLQMRPIGGGLVQVINTRTGQVIYTGSASGASNAQASAAGQARRILD